MKKKIWASCLAAALCLGSISFAETIPTIRVAERTISFNKPEGEMSGGVFTAPVRRICDVLGASVDWYEDKQMIIINSKDNMTRLFLYIGNENLRVFTFTSVAEGTAEEFKLDAPLKIENGRTLVPFEQICKALKAEVKWSDDRSVATIVTDEAPTDEKKVEMYLKVDKEDVNKDDIVEVSVMADNVDLYKDYMYAGYTAAVIYDPSEFEFVKSCIGDGSEDKYEGALGADNAGFTKDSVKAVYISVDKETFEGNTGVAGKLTFKALSDNGGKFKLSDRISDVGYDTSIMFTETANIKNTVLLQKSSELKLITDEIDVK